jgi:hypothetical protein
MKWRITHLLEGAYGNILYASIVLVFGVAGLIQGALRLIWLGMICSSIGMILLQLSTILPDTRRHVRVVLRGAGAIMLGLAMLFALLQWVQL